MTICPACQAVTLEASGYAVELNDVLHRWEKVLGKRFGPEVWMHYQPIARQPLTHFRCATCGFGCFEPVVEGTDAFYKSITEGEYYVADKWEHTQAIRDLRWENVGSVLDIGCGSGFFLKLLRKAEPLLQLAGQELCGSILDIDKYNVEMFIGRMHKIVEKLPADKKFDAITMFQVLEHAPDPWELLQVCSALLRPGGILIVSTPDSDGPIAEFKEALTEIPPHHLTQWTETAYRACLPRFGFDIVRVRREPLPHYLWDTYLPALWHSRIWPGQLFGKILNKEEGAEEDVRTAARLLREAGVTNLYGVPGHTILVIARRNNVA